MLTRLEKSPAPTLADYPRPKLKLACHRCSRSKEWSTRWLDKFYGRDTRLSEILHDFSRACGRHPGSDHRVGRNDERCEAYIVGLNGAP